ncbi:hypothetical protein [Campylobacter showae]|uniref:hypothetical protein n=1 Tax=Campylobacter showae TaxID=204 RepID=UPI001E450A1F|nr:hypothetical protein [Campylobacter showae]
MGSAWSYSAKERSADGKFSAEFDGLDLAVGAPSLGELRLYASAEALGLNLKRKESDSENENVKFSQSGEIEQDFKTFVNTSF